jgi:hypothetical protein
MPPPSRISHIMMKKVYFIPIENIVIEFFLLFISNGCMIAYRLYRKDISVCSNIPLVFAQDENQFIYNGFHQAFIIGVPGLTAFIGLPNNKYYSDKKHS